MTTRESDAWASMGVYLGPGQAGCDHEHAHRGHPCRRTGSVGACTE